LILTTAKFYSLYVEELESDILPPTPQPWMLAQYCTNRLSHISHTAKPSFEKVWGQRRPLNEAEDAMDLPETNLLRFLLVFNINFQLLENKWKEQPDSRRRHRLSPPEQNSWLRCRLGFFPFDVKSSKQKLLSRNR